MKLKTYRDDGSLHMRFGGAIDRKDAYEDEKGKKFDDTSTLSGCHLLPRALLSIRPWRKRF
jgi:hypothetical protein